MAKEIEYKFLIKDKSSIITTPKPLSVSVIRQGYLSKMGDNVTVRVRQTKTGEDVKSYLTIKSKSVGFIRDEFERTIDNHEANQMLYLCEDRIIEKTRFTFELPLDETSFSIHRLEVDVFRGKLEGLVLAEVEVENEKIIPILPDWCSVDVSADVKYSNAYLAEFGIPKE